jgi:hypothetical protein
VENDHNIETVLNGTSNINLLSIKLLHNLCLTFWFIGG